MSDAPKNTTFEGLYRAVGEAISKWVAIEDQLHQIFGICTSLVAMRSGGGYSFDDTIPSAVLDSIEGFHGRLHMINSALQAALVDLDDEAKQLLEDGLAAVASVRTLHGCRNKLAHWTVAQVETNTKTHELKPRLVPRRWLRGSRDTAQETDIDEWGVNFIGASIRSLSLC